MAVAPDIANVIGSAEQDAFTRLVQRLDQKKYRNRLKQHYYDGVNALKDLGISIPPRLRDVEVAMGWPAKAVDSLSRRVKMEEFVLPGGDVDAFGIPEIWRQNRMDIEVPMTQTSAFIHSVAFVLTTLGDQAAGEPEVLLSTFDATQATGLWNPTKRALGAGLAVLEDDEETGVSRMLLLFPHRIHTVWREGLGKPWNVRTVPNRLGRVPMEPIVYKPRLGRPFGSSRVSRPVMSITDSAMRTVLRSEVGAEFFSAPQRYLLGADEEMFTKADGSKATTWDLVMGRLLAIPNDEETGETPQVGQFPQVSMQPHTDHLAMWAKMFAGETGLPVSALGIIQDNPASAEAIYASKEELVIEAEAAAESFASPWVNAMISGIQMRDNLREVPPELRGLSARYRDPSTPSRQAAVDATLKLTQGDNPILPADSEVALEMAGFSDTDIKRIVADRRRARANSALDSILSRARAAGQAAIGQEQPPAEEV